MPKAPSQLDLAAFVRIYTNAANGPARLGSIAAGACVSAAEHKLAHAMQALRAGLIALVAKEVVGHGNFTAWTDEHFVKCNTVLHLEPSGLRMRLSRYMRVATAFAQATKMKPVASAWLQDGTRVPVSDSLREAAEEWIAGRSLTTIYKDEGIVRERDPHQVHTPAAQTPEQATQLELAGIIESLDSARAHLSLLTSTGNWEKLPKEKRFEFLQDALPTVENLALHTTWTNAERTALHQRLVSISTALQQAGREK